MNDNRVEDTITYEEYVKNDLLSLLTYGNIGFFTHCKVVQAVLIDKSTKCAWNYFTSIEFNQTIIEPNFSEFITDSPQSVNNNHWIALSTYTLSLEDFMSIYLSALQTQLWSYTDKSINSPVKLDATYHSAKKYIPENDPTGFQYGLVVPLEKSLYGSNFKGNYYICELYSKKQYLDTLLSDGDIQTIQRIFRKHHLGFNLYELRDRIGNVVCKFKIEILKYTPKSLGALNGISGEFALSEKCTDVVRFCIHIFREHDKMIYENRVEIFELEDNQVYLYRIEPNQCKNTTIVTNLENGLICFMEIRDYSVYSNYYSQIYLSHLVSIATMPRRKIIRNGTDVEIALSGIQMLGDIELFIEMNEAGKRQQQWNDHFFEEQRYFAAFTESDHEKAIEYLREIMNGKLIWDLEEIWLIDPYLMPNDILDTVVYCGKKDIIIKCLTSIGRINSNKATRELTTGDDKELSIEHKRFQELKALFNNQLIEAIPSNTDMRLEYRTVYAEHGMEFHDRFLIMNHKINKTRAWSLGISINSLGKSHHIIQIVEAPELIAKIFDDIWSNTNTPECLIYKS